YAHSLVVDESALRPVKDTIRISATIENPQSHDIMATVIFESLDSLVIDSTETIQTNLSTEAQFLISDIPENTYWVSVKVEDKTSGTSFINKHMTRISTIPLIIDSLTVNKIADYKYSIQPFIKNAGKSTDIEQIIRVTLTTNPWVTFITPKNASSATIKPGQVQKLAVFKLACDTTIFQNRFDLKFTIASQGWTFWALDTTITVIPTRAETLDLLPLANHMDQNYPNPFSNLTIIKWQLERGCRATLSIYDMLGRKVTTLLDEYRSAGKYETSIHAATLTKGIYFYQLKAGKFIQTRKMIVVK
ncbi:MAG TPA: T9SS type A sorting domain-containing protein, partial [Prolixibacteraceae bacterium]|nr:T9SS type A sorting domain-containing protein [Prolixibacteraceae bacterium]